MPEPETGPLDLEAVAAAVNDPFETHPACNVGEGPAGENREADAGIGRQASERPPDRGTESCRVRTAHDGRKGPVEVEDQEEARSRFELGLESLLEGVEAPGMRWDVAQRSLAPRSTTGKRDRSLRRRPAQR